jgi:hypothetical protein
MKCKKCEKEISKTDTFCQYCGTKVEEETETKVAVVEKRKEKKEKVKAEKVEAVKVEPVNTTNNSQPGKGLAIASMSLGIVGIVFTFFIGPLAFIFSLLGLIFALVAKRKCGFKLAGLITSIVGMVLQVIATIIIIFFFSAFMTILGEYLDTDFYKYSGDSVYGEWTCKPYPSYSYKSSEETTLKLNYDGTYIYGPSDDLDRNHYSGTFTYETEYDKNLENYSKGSKFYDLNVYVNEFMISGVKGSTYGKNLDMEMGLVDDYDTAYIMFYNTNNTYKCER